MITIDYLFGKLKLTVPLTEGILLNGKYIFLAELNVELFIVSCM